MDFPSTVVSEGSAVFHHGLLLLLFFISIIIVSLVISVFSLETPDLYDSIICKIREKIIGDLYEKQLEIYEALFGFILFLLFQGFEGASR